MLVGGTALPFTWLLDIACGVAHRKLDIHQRTVTEHDNTLGAIQCQWAGLIKNKEALLIAYP